MRNCIYILLFLLILSGCAAPLNIEKLESFTPDSKNFVLLNSSRFDNKIRVAMAKKGFKILKFASTEKVVSEGDQGEIARIHNEAEARYGLTFYYDQVDMCVTNSAKKINATFEISDLKTNGVLLVIEKGGWTEDCAYHKGGLFDDLSKILSENW